MSTFSVNHAPMQDATAGIAQVHQGMTSATEETSRLCTTAMELMDGDTKAQMAELHGRLWQAQGEHEATVQAAQRTLAQIHGNYVEMDTRGARQWQV